ncbi:OTU protein [Dispira simplex]|nr:OTU protein [Dispira simplex]
MTNAFPVIGLKKLAKSDKKKKKKETLAEIQRLEEELKQRHASELEAWEEAQVPATPDAEQVKEVTKGLDQLQLEGAHEIIAPHKKPNRQQRRLAKRQAKMATIQAEAAEEASHQVNMGEVENNAIHDLLKVNKLTLKEMESDGHCLFRAIADQLETYHNYTVTFSQLRTQAADYIRNHPDDFAPFLIDENGDLLDEEGYERYCNDVQFTAAWGGQPEILALAHVYKLPVHIIQMGSPLIKIAEEYKSHHPIRLSYHHHAFGLGQHYNSLHNKHLSI